MSIPIACSTDRVYLVRHLIGIKSLLWATAIITFAFAVS